MGRPSDKKAYEEFEVSMFSRKGVIDIQEIIGCFDVTFMTAQKWISKLTFNYPDQFKSNEKNTRCFKLVKQNVEEIIEKCGFYENNYQIGKKGEELLQELMKDPEAKKILDSKLKMKRNNN